MNRRLLIVEDEETLCESLKRVLQREGYDVDIAGSAESAFEIFEDGFYDLIITDIILPGITGIELLKKIREKMPEQMLVIMTAYASLETAVEALRNGAYDYIVKPVMHEEIKQVVKNALKQGALQTENLLLRKQLEVHCDLGRIIGESPAILRVISEIKKIADTDENVFLQGETGTGKGLAARAIHFSSKRADKPFIPVCCGAIAEDMIEYELFGHVKGALAGAATSGKGLLEAANEGTVFFDGFLNLSSGMQSRLLKVMEDREIFPVGGNRGIKLDIRFISAASGDVNQAIKEGAFMQDLFNRISSISIKLPPLRDRKEDIRPLANYFITKYSGELCRDIKGIDDEALGLLSTYNWPGNVRELRNIIERAILIAEGDIININNLKIGGQ